jgi:hypothetical protein
LPIYVSPDTCAQPDLHTNKFVSQALFNRSEEEASAKFAMLDSIVTEQILRRRWPAILASTAPMGLSLMISSHALQEHTILIRVERVLPVASTSLKATSARFGECLTIVSLSNLEPIH